LKDFVGPFDFFLAPRAQIQSDVPIFCGTIGIANIEVTNPVSTSVYTWSTPDGHIFGSTTGTSITADAAGTYIVTQKLQVGCSDYASDTTMVIFEPTCTVLPDKQVDLKGKLKAVNYLLDWMVWDNSNYKYFDIERSEDGVQFSHIQRVDTRLTDYQTASYNATDALKNIQSNTVYYRLKIMGINGEVRYTKVIRQELVNHTGIRILNNPAKENIRISINSNKIENAVISIYDITGKLMKATKHTNLPTGYSIITLDDLSRFSTGIYAIKVKLGEQVFF